MQKVRIDFSLTLILLFSGLSLCFLGLLAFFYGRNQVRTSYNCKIQIAKQAGLDRLLEIEHLAQGEVLFYQARSHPWILSWKEKGTFPMASEACLKNSGSPLPEWHRWFPAEGQDFTIASQKTNEDLAQLNREWTDLLGTQDSFFQDLQIDVAKLCHLRKSRDRFQNLLEKVQKSCQNGSQVAVPKSAKKAAQCRRDIDRLTHHLNARDREFQDNLSKGQSKWPAIATAFVSLLQNCPTVTLRSGQE